MQLVEVDEVGLEPAQRRVDRVHDVTAAVAGVPRLRAHRPEALRRDHELVAAALQPAAEDLLGAAGGREVAAERVHVGGVEEGDALLVGVIEDGARAVLVDLESEGHGAEADPRDLEPGAAETNVLHGAVLSVERIPIERLRRKIWNAERELREPGARTANCREVVR